VALKFPEERLRVQPSAVTELIQVVTILVERDPLVWEAASSPSLHGKSALLVHIQYFQTPFPYSLYLPENPCDSMLLIFDKY
jgi:hypothetical protein